MESFIAHIEQFHPLWIYLILFFAGVLEYIFPPFPGDSIILFGAFLAAKGVINIHYAFAVTTLGFISGLSLLYWFGLKKGRQFFMKRNTRFFSIKTLTKTELHFQKYGWLLIVVHRFLFSLRMIVILLAGIGQLPFKRMLAFSMVSLMLWNVLLFYLGFVLQLSYETLSYYFQYSSNLFYLIVLLGMGVYFLIRQVRN
ncbi:MAG: DedA family protein [Deltaproteobacteria bacterium]|nr:DedA family protein [Deltaproteobacteria bacterium]